MRSILLILTTSLLFVSGCGKTSEPAPAIGMANPAAVYCNQQGGKSEPVTTEAGQSSNCHLPDGRVIEEWALYRADHPASVAGAEN
jgi:putative hemolysin